MDKWTESRVEMELSYLGHASPDSAYLWLERHAAEEQHAVPDEILGFLRTRDHPLINLGLARSARSCALLRELYQSGDDGVRAAVLSNPNSLFLREFFTEEEEQNFVKSASLPLLHAYLTNRNLDVATLRAVLPSLASRAQHSC